MSRPGPAGPPHRYADRAAAGVALAAALADQLGSVDPAAREPGRSGVVLLGLARGGVPVAAAAAAELQVCLDVLVVRKLALPEHPEFAVGAIAAGGVQVTNTAMVSRLAVSDRALAPVLARERAELARREQVYRAGAPPARLDGRTAVLVDDGLATGTSMRAAVAAVRRQEPAAVVVAVPVAAPSAVAKLSAEADRVVCPLVPEAFVAVGQFYLDFGQTSDEQVRAALAGMPAGLRPGPAGPCR